MELKKCIYIYVKAWNTCETSLKENQSFFRDLKTYFTHSPLELAYDALKASVLTGRSKLGNRRDTRGLQLRKPVCPAQRKCFTRSGRRPRWWMVRLVRGCVNWIVSSNPERCSCSNFLCKTNKQINEVRSVLCDARARRQEDGTLFWQAVWEILWKVSSECLSPLSSPVPNSFARQDPVIFTCIASLNWVWMLLFVDKVKLFGKLKVNTCFVFGSQEFCMENSKFQSYHG